MGPDALELRTQAVLEWARLLEQLSSLCLSEAGAGAMLARRPADTLEEARVRNRRAAQAIALDEIGELFELRAFPEIGAALERARVGSMLSGTELRDVTRVLDLAKSLRSFASAQRAERPELAQAIDSDPGLDRLLDRLTKAIDPDGSVSDHASPALRDARDKARTAREELKRRLEESMRKLSPLLQGQYYTEREGRYVLPVRADAHQRVEGVVLAASGSGGTLFVEPREVTEYGNRLKIREAAVERETARVLSELTAELGSRTSTVEEAFEACVEADQLQALSRFAGKARAHPFEPRPEAVIELLSMRHPLLLAGDHAVVANDVRVVSGRALVISGPNAGGKTVTLKCLGLAAWMARAGVPIPADPASRVGFFGSVLADVGDEQSLARNLSTFSAHLVTIAEIARRSGPDTLVLLDELAAGTDPEEGAALAAAILEALSGKGAAVAVTTHYERLKEQAAEGSKPFDNASVGFDFEAMAPTFKLLLGVPGPSSALAVARRFGLEPQVVERARELLPAHAVRREAIVRKLETERAELEKERVLVREELGRQAALRAELEARVAAEEREEREELARESRELLVLVRQARNDVREARRRLKEAKDSSELRDLERTVSRAAAHVALGGALEQRTRAGAAARADAPAVPLTPGATVRLRKTGALAVVEAAPERGQVRLRAGSMKWLVPVADVEPTSAAARRTPQKPEKARRTLASPPAFAAPVRTSDNTLDLRGERMEAAIDLVDAFLDRMLGEGHAVGFVLHGHGTGVLKSAVREHLRASSYVANARPAESDEGGDAFTVFWIKE